MEKNFSLQSVSDPGGTRHRLYAVKTSRISGCVKRESYKKKVHVRVINPKSGKEKVLRKTYPREAEKENQRQ